MWIKPWEGIHISEVPPYSQFVIKDEILYIVVSGTLYTLNAETGEVYWSVGDVGHAFVAPLVDEDGKIFTVGQYTPYISAVDPDGNVLWQERDSELNGAGDIYLDDDALVVQCLAGTFRYSKDGERLEKQLLSEKVNNQILENTKSIESLDYSFSNFMITFEEYEESIKDISGRIDMEENLNRNFPMPNESIKTLTKDELEMMAEKSGTYSVNVEISGIYDKTDIKYVYTKADLVPDENNEVGVQLTETRRYIYVLEDGQWILADIERRMYEKDVDIEDMDHVRFENELVEYIGVVDLMEK